MKKKTVRSESHYTLISTVALLAGVSTPSVMDAARIFNHRIIGDRIWFRTPTSAAFVEECWRIEAMRRAALERQRRGRLN